MLLQRYVLFKVYESCCNCAEVALSPGTPWTRVGNPRARLHHKVTQCHLGETRVGLMTITNLITAICLLKQTILKGSLFRTPKDLAQVSLLLSW